jgi:secreted PhoX family phosphatase
MPPAHDDPFRAHVDDDDHNRSGNPRFLDVLEAARQNQNARVSRRSVLRGGMGTAAAAVLGGWSVAACGGGDGSDPLSPALPAPPDGTVRSLGFAPVAKSLADKVSVPAGYTALPIYALGDPLAAGLAPYRNDGTDTDLDQRAGDHHDGMAYFGLDAAGTRRDPAGSARGLLAMNHEATSQRGSDVRSYYLHADGGTPNPRPGAEADKEMAVHGLSVVEVRQTVGRWASVQGSRFNRRVTPLTPIEIAGPARGHALMKTRYSPDGTRVRGTINNCGCGVSPWGTYLTGEENWAGYFTRAATDDAARGNDRSVASLKRYGRAQGAASRHGWETAGSSEPYARWDIGRSGAGADGGDDYRHEMNAFGYIVEMDPYDRAAPLRKRTALGRFNHESAAFGLPAPGRPLAVYMGDDAIGEYLYKFVSRSAWDPADARPANPVATGDKYLDDGRLFAARFESDGTGRWIELDIADPRIAGFSGYAFADQADVLVNARLAADAVGATRMDRPEWCAVHPQTGEVYYTLTKNGSRKVEPGAGQQGVDSANPRSYVDVQAGVAGAAGNVNGHIVRLAEAGGMGAATAFTWDVYLFGAEAGADPARVNLSGLTDDQDFSSPDGLWFSQSTGLCWIQTDDGSYTDVTNCMMLLGVPGKVGDGAKATLTHTRADGSPLSVDTWVGRKPSAGTLRRFLVGPVDCELTGCAETPDGRTVFANIQHPGEVLASVADILDPAKYPSHWPGNAGYQAAAGNRTSRPRSATLAITKDDGGRVGT